MATQYPFDMRHGTSELEKGTSSRSAISHDTSGINGVSLTREGVIPGEIVSEYTDVVHQETVTHPNPTLILKRDGHLTEGSGHFGCICTRTSGAIKPTSPVKRGARGAHTEGQLIDIDPPDHNL